MLAAEKDRLHSDPRFQQVFDGLLSLHHRLADYLVDYGADDEPLGGTQIRGRIFCSCNGEPGYTAG